MRTTAIAGAPRTAEPWPRRPNSFSCSSGAHSNFGWKPWVLASTAPPRSPRLGRGLVDRSWRRGAVLGDDHVGRHLFLASSRGHGGSQACPRYLHEASRPCRAWPAPPRCRWWRRWVGSPPSPGASRCRPARAEGGCALPRVTTTVVAPPAGVVTVVTGCGGTARGGLVEGEGRGNPRADDGETAHRQADAAEPEPEEAGLVTASVVAAPWVPCCTVCAAAREAMRACWRWPAAACRAAASSCLR